MNKDEYKKYIIETVNKIDNIKFFKPYIKLCNEVSHKVVGEINPRLSL